MNPPPGCETGISDFIAQDIRKVEAAYKGFVKVADRIGRRRSENELE
jgi:hypothetical protein